MTAYNPKSLKAEEFISDEEIRATLSYAEENKNKQPMKKQKEASSCYFLASKRFVYVIIFPFL